MGLYIHTLVALRSYIRFWRYSVFKLTFIISLISLCTWIWLFFCQGEDKAGAVLQLGAIKAWKWIVYLAWHSTGINCLLAGFTVGQKDSEAHWETSGRDRGRGEGTGGTLREKEAYVTICLCANSRLLWQPLKSHYLSFTQWQVQVFSIVSLASFFLLYGDSHIFGKCPPPHSVALRFFSPLCLCGPCTFLPAASLGGLKCLCLPLCVYVSETLASFC